MAAPLLFAPAVAAQEPPFPRANIVGCAKSVDGLGDTLRVPMQSHCLTLAIAKCEAPDSGPAQVCFSDLEAAMSRYAAQLEPLLDTEVPRDASSTLCSARFSSDTNRARCTAMAEFGHLRDLFDEARGAGLVLP